VKSIGVPDLRATNALVLFLVLAFIASTVLFPVSYVGYLGFSVDGFLQGGKFWTPLTYMFSHLNLFELAVNMLFLYVFGNALESKVGAVKTVSAFLVGGVAGLIIGLPFYSPDTTILGSSIAVSTLLGAVIVLNPDSKSSPLFLYLPLGLVALIYVIFNAFMLIYDQSGGVAWPSHIIGFCAGVLLGILWRRKNRPVANS
jgi:membrane associated rhomboid family serine protease